MKRLRGQKLYKSRAILLIKVNQRVDQISSKLTGFRLRELHLDQFYPQKNIRKFEYTQLDLQMIENGKMNKRGVLTVYGLGPVEYAHFCV